MFVTISSGAKAYNLLRSHQVHSNAEGVRCRDGGQHVTDKLLKRCHINITFIIIDDEAACGWMGSSGGGRKDRGDSGELNDQSWSNGQRRQSSTTRQHIGWKRSSIMAEWAKMIRSTTTTSSSTRRQHMAGWDPQGVAERTEGTVEN